MFQIMDMVGYTDGAYASFFWRYRALNKQVWTQAMIAASLGNTATRTVVTVHAGRPGDSLADGYW